MRSVSRETIELCHKLNRIPHLNLTRYLPRLPLYEMVREHAQFKAADYFPYITGNKNEALAKHMAENWRGFCIIDSCVEGRHNIDYLTTENNFKALTWRTDEHGAPMYAPTDVGSKLPTVIKYLYSIIERPQKTRISRIMPHGGNATWHSHYLLALGGDRRFVMNDLTRLENKIVEPVIHIPLVTNKDVWFGVAERNPDREKTKVHWQHYGFGQIWLFNSFFWHNVYNNGSRPRDHIMMYMPADDSRMLPILQQAVHDYRGPLLDEGQLA